MSRRCVVNVAVGGWYPRGQDRLARSLDETGFGGDVLFWKDENPPGCPSHEELPYGFKVHALEMALYKGYGPVLWCDASIWFIKNPSTLFDVIDERGYWFMSQGWQVGTWCSDDALPKLGIEREESMKMSMVAATMFGLDMRTEEARQILGWMRARCRDGSFRGSWTNEHQEVSPDPRVKGHRHDQTALSVVVNRLGLEIDWHPSWFEYAYDGVIPNPKCVALARGM